MAMHEGPPDLTTFGDPVLTSPHLDVVTIPYRTHSPHESGDTASLIGFSVWHALCLALSSAECLSTDGSTRLLESGSVA